MLIMLARAHVDGRNGKASGTHAKYSVPGAELAPELAAAAGYALPVAAAVEDVAVN